MKIDMATILQWEMALFFILLGSIILWRLALGRIVTKHLLSQKCEHRAEGEPPHSVPRLQAFIATIGFAVYYASQLSTASTQLPPVPDEMLYTLMGSHGFYLATKTYGGLFQK